MKNKLTHSPLETRIKVVKVERACIYRNISYCRKTKNLFPWCNRCGGCGCCRSSCSATARTLKYDLRFLPQSESLFHNAWNHRQYLLCLRFNDAPDAVVVVVADDPDATVVVVVDSVPSTAGRHVAQQFWKYFHAC